MRRRCWSVAAGSSLSTLAVWGRWIAFTRLMSAARAAARSRRSVSRLSSRTSDRTGISRITPMTATAAATPAAIRAPRPIRLQSQPGTFVRPGNGS